MKDGTLAIVSAATAQEVCRRFAVGEEAGRLLRADMTPRQYLDLLVETELFVDAARFLAHALPKREAVSWAFQCARQAHGANPPAAVAAALDATQKWVADPSEENRRAAFAAAEAADFGTPAGCAAVAAFWSGGSLGPPHVPVIPPGEQLTANGVAGAVMLAVVLTEPEKAPEKYRRFLGEGIELANGSPRTK